MRVVDAGNALVASQRPEAVQAVSEDTSGGDAAGDLPGNVVLRLALLPDELRDELARQARELADHLRQEAESVDRREAQLDARQAEFEQQVRSATLWLTEERDQLDRRAELLDSRERLITQRESNVHTAEEFLDTARRETERRLGQLNGGQAPQSARREVKSTTAGTSGSPVDWSQIESAWSELRAQQDRLAQREQSLEVRGELLNEQRVELVKRARQLRTSISRHQQDIHRQTTRVKRSLARRARALEEQRYQLEQLYAQVRARYREVLLTRMATERLCRDAVGPEGALLLEHAAAEARARLKEDDRREIAALQRRAVTIEKARRELLRRQSQLIQRCDDPAGGEKLPLAPGEAGSDPPAQQSA